MLVWVLRLFLFSYRVVGVLVRSLTTTGQWAKAVFVGVWLGVLPQRVGHRLNDLWYSGATRYVEDAFNRRGLFFNEAAMVARHFPAGGRILVGGAGGGREILHLHRLGYEVAGFECNVTLVDYANKFLAANSAPPSVVLAEPDHCIDAPSAYDGFLVGWGVYIHIIGRAARVNFLKEAGAVLSPHGVMILGYCNRDSSESFFRIVRRLAGPLRRGLYGETIEEGDKLEPTLEHHFTSTEIEEEFAAGGFTIVDHDSSIPGRALIVARPLASSSTGHDLTTPPGV